MKNDKQLLAELARATEGLLFMSESDYPFELVRWGKDRLTRAAVRRHTGQDESVEITTQTLGSFFRVAASEPDWKGPNERATARRYQALVRWLRQHLSGVRVYRIGRVNIDVYIVGRSPTDNVFGLHTHVVET